MKKCMVFYAGLALLFLVLLLDSGCSKSKRKSLATQKDKVSYTIGWDIGNNFKKQYVDIDHDILIMGIKDAQAGAKPLLNDEDMRSVMMAFQTELRDKQTKERSVMGEKNKKEGEEFLAQNKQKEGVKVAASGLQYKVIKEGNGAKPKPSDIVAVNYEGKLVNGTVFDSSYKRGGLPATFRVDGVIRGWTEALQLMKVGSKYELCIPSELGYGERGAGMDIGPNAVLVFTVELLSINDKVKK